MISGEIYQGIYDKSLIPIKAKRGCKLNPVLKPHNREINKRRRRIEQVFGALKIFRILSECYRNRGKRLGLRSNLIARIYNIELNEK